MTKSLHHSFAQVRSNKCRYALLFSISITWIAGCLQVESFQLSPLRQVRQRTRPITGILSSTLEGHDPAEAQQPGQNKKSLQDLLLPSNACKVDQMSGTQLAYIGDVVFELYIRSRHVWPSKRTSDLQNKVVAIVRAEHQAHLLDQLKTTFPLTDREKQVLSRGRNAVTKSKNRRNPAAYQDSTSFEAFIGYLYICDQARCEEVLNWLDDIVDQVDS